MSAIVDLAALAGASVPVLRSPSLVDNHTPIAPVIADAADNMSIPGDLQTICVLFATWALLQPAGITEAIQTFEALEGFDHLMGVSRHPAPIERPWRRTGDGSAEMVNPMHRLTRSQDVDLTEQDTGQVYVSRPSAWQLRMNGELKPTHLDELPATRVVDPYDEDDRERA